MFYTAESAGNGLAKISLYHRIGQSVLDESKLYLKQKGQINVFNVGRETPVLPDDEADIAQNVIYFRDQTSKDNFIRLLNGERLERGAEILLVQNGVITEVEKQIFTANTNDYELESMTNPAIDNRYLRSLDGLTSYLLPETISVLPTTDADLNVTYANDDQSRININRLLGGETLSRRDRIFINSHGQFYEVQKEIFKATSTFASKTYYMTDDGYVVDENDLTPPAYKEISRARFETMRESLIDGQEYDLAENNNIPIISYKDQGEQTRYFKNAHVKTKFGAVYASQTDADGNEREIEVLRYQPRVDLRGRLIERNPRPYVQRFSTDISRISRLVVNDTTGIAQTLISNNTRDIRVTENGNWSFTLQNDRGDERVIEIDFQNEESYSEEDGVLRIGYKRITEINCEGGKSKYYGVGLDLSGGEVAILKGKTYNVEIGGKPVLVTVEEGRDKVREVILSYSDSKLGNVRKTFKLTKSQSLRDFDVKIDGENVDFSFVFDRDKVKVNDGRIREVGYKSDLFVGLSEETQNAHDFSELKFYEEAPIYKYKRGELVLENGQPVRNADIIVTRDQNGEVEAYNFKEKEELRRRFIEEYQDLQNRISFLETNGTDEDIEKLREVQRRFQEIEARLGDPASFKRVEDLIKEYQENVKNGNFYPTQFWTGDTKHRVSSPNTTTETDMLSYAIDPNTMFGKVIGNDSIELKNGKAKVKFGTKASNVAIGLMNASSVCLQASFGLGPVSILILPVTLPACILSAMGAGITCAVEVIRDRVKSININNMTPDRLKNMQERTVTKQCEKELKAAIKDHNIRLERAKKYDKEHFETIKRQLDKELEEKREKVFAKSKLLGDMKINSKFKPNDKKLTQDNLLGFVQHKASKKALTDRVKLDRTTKEEIESLKEKYKEEKARIKRDVDKEFRKSQYAAAKKLFDKEKEEVKNTFFSSHGRLGSRLSHLKQTKAYLSSSDEGRKTMIKACKGEFEKETKSASTTFTAGGRSDASIGRFTNKLIRINNRHIQSIELDEEKVKKTKLEKEQEKAEKRNNRARAKEQKTREKEAETLNPTEKPTRTQRRDEKKANENPLYMGKNDADALKYKNKPVVTSNDYHASKKDTAVSDEETEFQRVAEFGARIDEAVAQIDNMQAAQHPIAEAHEEETTHEAVEETTSEPDEETAEAHEVEESARVTPPETPSANAEAQKAATNELNAHIEREKTRREQEEAEKDRQVAEQRRQVVGANKNAFERIPNDIQLKIKELGWQAVVNTYYSAKVTSGKISSDTQMSPIEKFNMLMEDLVKIEDNVNVNVTKGVDAEYVKKSAAHERQKRFLDQIAQSKTYKAEKNKLDKRMEEQQRKHEEAVRERTETTTNTSTKNVKNASTSAPAANVEEKSTNASAKGVESESTNTSESKGTAPVTPDPSSATPTKEIETESAEADVDNYTL